MGGIVHSLLVGAATAATFCASPCKIEVEPKVEVSQIISHSTSFIPTTVRFGVQQCGETGTRRRLFGVDSTLVGCFNEPGTLIEEWEVSIPLIQSDDIERLKSSQVALYRGHNNTMIMFLKDGVVNSLRRELDRMGHRATPISLKYEIVNDTPKDVTMAVSSVWVNDVIPVGQQLTMFIVPTNNFATVTISDTGVSALLNSGTEPVSIIPFE